MTGMAIMAGIVNAACGKTTRSVGPTDTSVTVEGGGSGQALLPPSLVGPTWKLVSIDGRATVPGTRVTAVFGEDDRVAGSAGCNRYFGGAAVTGESLAVSPLATTMMHCGAPGVMPQEHAYLAALQGVAAYRITGTRLELGPASRIVTLLFELDQVAAP
jgi:heat shock protein HslJ